MDTRQQFDPHEEYKAALALRHTPGLGVKRFGTIAGAYASLCEAAADASSWVSEKLAPPSVARAFAERRWREGAEREFESARRANMRAITYHDPLYPPQLREMVDPPVMLYVAGDVALLSNVSVAVVGARKCSRDGLALARRIGEELSHSGVTIVSGMASGIDRQAHLAGLAGVGSSVAVLGTGLDVVYPLCNADLYDALCERGAVVSEYALGSPAEPHNFPVRNRIISGLALGVLVAEAAEKSGSLITARQAMEQGKEVYAVPGSLSSPTFSGCNALIREGAQLVRGSLDIIESLATVLRSLGTVSASPPPRQAELFAPEQPHAEQAVDEAFTTETEGAPAHQGVLESLLSRLPRSILSRLGAAEVRPAGRPSATPTLDAQSSATPGSATGGSVTPHSLRPVADHTDLQGTEALVVDVLIARHKLHIDEIARELSLSPTELSGVLVSLELKGLVRQWPGMYYTAD